MKSEISEVLRLIDAPKPVLPAPPLADPTDGIIANRISGLKIDINKLKVNADSIIKKQKHGEIKGFTVALQNNLLDLNSLIEYACLHGRLLKHKDAFKGLESDLAAL